MRRPQQHGIFNTVSKNFHFYKYSLNIFGQNHLAEVKVQMVCIVYIFRLFGLLIIHLCFHDSLNLVASLCMEMGLPKRTFHLPTIGFQWICLRSVIILVNFLNSNLSPVPQWNQRHHATHEHTYWPARQHSCLDKNSVFQQQPKWVCCCFGVSVTQVCNNYD